MSHMSQPPSARASYVGAGPQLGSTAARPCAKAAVPERDNNVERAKSSEPASVSEIEDWHGVHRPWTALERSSRKEPRPGGLDTCDIATLRETAMPHSQSLGPTPAPHIRRSTRSGMRPVPPSWPEPRAHREKPI